MGKSLFIEGLDGSGKSTQIALLEEYLIKSGEQVLTLREPGGTAYYQAIREHVHFQTYERPPLSDALTCAGGIAANIAATKKALANGSWVVSDRSFHSNAVYQIANGLAATTAHAINSLAIGDFKYDYAVLIDIPIEAAQARLESIGKKKDRYESLGTQYFSRVRELYLKTAKHNNFHVIDGKLSIEEIHHRIIQLIS